MPEDDAMKIIESEIGKKVVELLTPDPGYNHNFTADRILIDWLEILKAGVAKDRAGHKVRIYAIDGGGDSPIHGAYRHNFDNFGWRVESWNLLGEFLAGKETSMDIVGPWYEETTSIPQVTAKDLKDEPFS